MICPIKDSQGHSVQILGRTGTLYTDETGEYFIDSEILVGPDYDLVIYKNRIRFYDETNSTVISDKKKEEILTIALKLFESDGTKVDVM